MQRNRQIIAIGGISKTNDGALFNYVLKQAVATSPRIGFLPTASADSDDYIVRFYEAFTALACRPSHLKLFGRVRDPATFIEEQDIILVGGGNTKTMLGVWREWALDSLIRDAWESGTVIAGFSAGAICWFQEALSDSWADRLAVVVGLGFLPGSCCPHFSNEPDRRPTYHRLLLAGAISSGLGIDDDCAVHFCDASPSRVVKATAAANAYTVSVGGGSIFETPLESEVVLLQAAAGPRPTAQGTPSAARSGDSPRSGS
jgi:peptidase E